MKFRDYYQAYEEKIGIIFSKYGTLITNYPWYVLFTSILVNGLLGIGLLYIESENDVETLYCPTNSQAFQDKQKLLNLFYDNTESNFNPYTLSNLGVYGEVLMKSLNGENILQTEYLDELLRIDEYVKSEVTVKNDTTDKTQSYIYDDLCARREGKCVMRGQLIIMPIFRSILKQNLTEYLQYEEPQFKYVFGNVTTRNGTLTSATVVKLRYNLRQDKNYLRFSKQWELNFIKKMDEFKSNITEIAYAYSESLNHELNDNTKGDVRFFSFTFTLMLIYASFAASGGNCVSQRQNLGRAGVLATGLSILGSFGLVAALGVKFVNIVGVMPFLILGIGIDDMFILMSGAADQCSSETVLQKIKATLKTAGVAITITSLTDFLAFAIGSTSVFMSVKNFCIYTGVAVVMCYINQLTFFMPCMVIHEKRVHANRHAFTCLKVKTGIELRKEGRDCCFVCCCSGRPPKSREEIESPFEKYPKLIFQRLVLYKPAKILIVILFIAYSVASIYGTLHLEQGLTLRNLVIEDSHYYKYSQWDWDYFPTEIPVQYIFDDPNLNYSNTTIQNEISTFIKYVQSQSYINSEFQINWLQFYKESAYYVNTTEKDFIEGLKKFLNVHFYLQGDVIFDESSNRIKASRFHVITPSMKESTVQGNMMLRTRELADTSGLPVFAYSPPFIYFEQYVTVLPNTIQTVGIAVAAMVFVTALLMPHPLLVFLVTLTMIMIMFGVFGFMHFWGLTLSSITMIHIVMSVGFSVDFSAHICHAYVSVEGTDRNSRVSAALARSGAPVFNAAASSIIGILMLVFSKSYVFQSFFKLMILVILFGLAHSMLLLPVILSWVGPTIHRNILENGFGIKKNISGNLNNSYVAGNSEENGVAGRNHNASSNGVVNKHADIPDSESGGQSFDTKI